MKALVICAAVLAASSVARADDRAKAEQYFRAGEQAFRHQSFAAAAESFELAYKEMEIPEIAFSAAQAYRRQYFIEPKPQYCKRAVELYRVYLGKVKSGGRVGDASDGLAEMQRELDRLGGGGQTAAPRADATRVIINVTVGEQKTTMTELSMLPASDAIRATATLDGKPVELYTQIDVTPGEHTVAIAADGYIPVTETHKVAPGETDPIEVRLVEKPARLTFSTESDAQIAIDGRVLGTTPLATQDVASGSHVLVAMRRGRETVSRSLELARGEVKTVTIAMRPTARRRAVPWLVGAGGVLALGSGASALIAVLADNKMSDIEHDRETVGITQKQLADYRSDTDRRDTFRDTAWVLGSAAVVAGATAVVLYYFDAPAAPPERMVVPVASPTSAGVAVVGRF